MSDLTRDDLLGLTPDRYLADGFLDPAGRPRRELRGEFVPAACTQLMAAELSPQELGFTVDAIRLLLPEHDEADPQERLHAVVEEALEVVARAIQQRNNRGLLQWLSACAAPVRTEADIEAFMQHIDAVRLQYALLAAMAPSSSPSLQA